MKKLDKTAVEKRELSVRIMQFGEGNFLRAFVDWMIDEANEKHIMKHGIMLVQPIRGGKEVYNLFKEQDCLYHVYLEGIKNKKPVKEISLVKSIVDIINPYEEYVKYEELFLSDQLEIVVSNTTEAGIRYEKDDLNALPPSTFPGKMTALLYKRYQKFNGDPDKGLLVVCCELIEDNGTTLREYILRHATENALETGFLNWLKTACHFYDTLVDRIVPGFPRENINEVKQELGYDDNLVVKGEYFHVWAIGGDPVIRKKLPLDKAGFNVMFMDDIKAFRAKKVRILNGAHTAMVPVGLQLGCCTVKEAFGVPEIESYINKMVEQEVLPVIDEDMNELKAFAAKILERFYNPYLNHYLQDISLNSLSKWETRDYPTVRDNYFKKEKSAHLAVFSLAALLVLYSGHSEAKDFTPKDTQTFIDFIQSKYTPDNLDKWVNEVLTNRDIWTEDFSEIPGFIKEVSEDVNLILSKGMLEAIREKLSNIG